MANSDKASVAENSSFLDIRDENHPLASLLLSREDGTPSAQQQQHPKTFKPEVPSALLSRVAAFLPQIEAANMQLMQNLTQDDEKRKEVDIENVDEDEQYIQMDLGVGVFETQPTSDQEPELREKDIIMSAQPTADPCNKPLIEVIAGRETLHDTTSDSHLSDDSTTDDATSSSPSQEKGAG